MAQVKMGDKVRIDFTGTLEDGTVFDSTLEQAECLDECDADEHATGDCGCGSEIGPMELTIGAHQLFAQIDEALVGMAPGEEKTVVIPAADAFGEFDEEKVFTAPRSSFPDDFDPEVGEELILTNEDGEELGVAVVEVGEEELKFDANHPLAGEDLTYKLQLVEIL